MLGLILKDIKNVRGQMIYYLVVLVVFTVVAIVSDNIYYYVGAIVFFLVALPVSAMAYDEKDNWDKFALASGMSRKQLVVARYLFSLLFYVPLWAISFIFLAVPGDLSAMETLAIIFFYGGMGFFTADVLLPLVFKMGVEKARITFIVMIVLVVAIGAGLAFLFNLETGNAILYLAVAVFVSGAACFPVSMKISEKIYKRKDF